MTPTKIYIHCSDTTNGLNVSLDRIKTDHIKRGFGGIGYNAIIQADGTLEQTRGYNVPGCHVSGENSTSIGICLAGNDKFTKEQFDRLKYLIDSLTSLYNIKPSQVFCHYQAKTAITQGKTCPNIIINDLLYFLWSGEFKHVAQYMCERGK